MACSFLSSLLFTLSCLPLDYEAEKQKKSGADVHEDDREKANFGLSGALAKDAVTGNVYNGVVLKWTEPLDAKPPGRGWRVYVFKGEEVVETLHLRRQAGFLFGREARVADHVLGERSPALSSGCVVCLCATTLDVQVTCLSHSLDVLTLTLCCTVCDVPAHPSCSNQHAVIQFRNTSTAGAAGEAPAVSVKPYLLDLQSSHGTMLNGAPVQDSRFVELRAGDVLKFGFSTREYVLVREPD